MEKLIVSKFSELIAKDHFIIDKDDLKSNSLVRFYLKNQSTHYYLIISFLKYGSIINIEPRLVVCYDQLTGIMQQIKDVNSNNFKGWLAISSLMGIYINPKNQDGYFNSNETIEFRFEKNANGSAEQISETLYSLYMTSIKRYIEETVNVFSLDFLINTNEIVNIDKPVKPRVHFSGNLPWQINTGIMAAKLSGNKNYDLLLDKYTAYMNGLSNDNPYKADYFKIVNALY